MKTRLHADGEAHARCLIRSGKVSHGPWSFDAGDRDRLLGPRGSHVEEYARHHLGVDEPGDEEPDGDERTEVGTPPPQVARDLDSAAGSGVVSTAVGHERFKYPFAKDGQLHTRALRSIRSAAFRHGHHDVYQAAQRLLEEAAAGHEEPDNDELEGRSFVVAGDREVRCLMAGLELRSAASGGPGTLVGYAAVFDRFSEDLGLFRETIAPGAFAGCIGRDARALVNHDPGQLLGRESNGTLRMAEDSLGLRVEIDLPDTQVGRDTAANVRRGDLDGMSFSFETAADAWDRGTTPPTRTLIRCRRVHDVGPVTYPAYTDTRVALRSLDRAAAPPQATPEPEPRATPAPPVPDPLTQAKARLRLAEASTPP